MTHLKYLSQSRLVGLVLVAGGVLGPLAACSSDGGNAAPTNPVINTGGGGAKNGGSAGDSNSDAGTPDQGGSTNSNGGSTPTGDAGEAGQGGAAGGNAAGEGPGGGSGGMAGSGGTPAACPSTDVGFFNQTSTSQRSAFDNVKRLGTHATLPSLP
ncbi:MAG: hypothetical protein ABI548_18260 [Polyangiaceae bacterium]